MTSESMAEGESIWLAAFVFLAIASGLGVAGKLLLISHITHLPQPIAAGMIACGLCLPLLWRVAIRYRKLVAPLFFLGIVAASIFVYPKIAGLHAEGRGSDQADCILVASQKMTALHFPYGENFLWSGHPMSCGPGWVLLQSPAIRLAGYSFNLILLWALALLTLRRAIGTDRTLAFMALLALAPGLWLGVANGSDFASFGVVLAALIAASELPGSARTLVAVAGALVLQFRTPTILIAGFLRQTLGRSRALAVGLAAILVQLLFVLADPPDFTHFGPFFLWRKAFGSGALFQKPLLLAIIVTAGLIVGVLVTLWAGRFVTPATGALGFLLLVLGPMALLNLIGQIRESGVSLHALGVWEGGMWLSACVPLVALAVARRWPVTDAASR